MTEIIMDDAEHNLYRVAGAVVLTPGNLDAVDRQDMLDSILLAQLFANKRHMPQTNPDQWIHACILSLGNLNWTVTSSNSTQSNLISPFSAASAMSAAIKPQDKEIATLLRRLPLETIRNLDRYRRGNTEGGSPIRLPIARAHRRGEFQLRTLEFASTSIIEDDWMHQEHNASASCPVPAKFSDLSFYLTEDFKSVRNKVISTLGDKRAKEIHSIDPTPIK